MPLLWPSALFGQTWQVVEYDDTDALGSIRIVTDAQGQVVARHDFLPFGEELNPQTPPHDKKLFTGQERDFETGQDYFGARYYRADVGRFLAPDPITLVPRVVGAQGANIYAYVRNNPLGLIDPSGLDPTTADSPQEIYPNWSPTDLPLAAVVDLVGEMSFLMGQGGQWARQYGRGCALCDSGGTGAPRERFVRDADNNLVYTDEPYGGALTTCDACASVSSPYGAPRDNGTTMHTGSDLATAGVTGIDALSLTDGKVVQVGASGSGPHSVTVVTAKGTFFTYGHLASNYVNVGDSINAGARLGEIGNLGVSSGIHLHVQASIVASDATGDETGLPRFPDFSPAGGHVLVRISDDEQIGFAVQIWRREGHTFVREWSGSPYADGSYTAYRLIGWCGEDTIDLQAETSFEPPKPSVTTDFQLRHSAQGWRVVETRGRDLP